MQQFLNNWSATLTLPAAAADPELNIEPADAAKLGTIAPGDYYAATLARLGLVDEVLVEVAWEVVHITAVTSGVLTVLRNREGTTALDWLAGEGISVRVTKGTLEELRAEPLTGEAVTDALGYTPATAAQGALADTAVQPAALSSGLDGKVDKETGKGLSQENYTTAEKAKLAALESSRFKGLYPDLPALQAAHPTASAGDYADVDAGVGIDTARYVWDVSDTQWVLSGSGAPLTAAQVKTLYESNPDTNAYTDTEKSKLAGIESGANDYVHPNHTGDVTSTGDGAQTIANNAVTNAKAADMAASTIKGRATAGTGDPEDLSAAQVRTIINVADGANNYSHPNHSGDVTSIGDGVQTIANDAVTNTKLANMATATLKGRTTAGTGDPEDLTAAQARTLLNVANGATALSVVQALASTRNLALGDINTFNVNSTASAYTVTIPLQSSVAWTADAEVHFLKANTGNVVITAAAGVLLNGVDGGSVTISQTGGAASIKRRAADSWWVGGLLASPNLDALAALTGAADKGIYFTGAGAMATHDLTAFGRGLVGSANAAAARTTLGVGTGDSPTFTALTLSNGQIVFPATQVPSANANTLDDYEEGTWTPVATFATPGDLSVVHSSQIGTYVKIGSQVTLGMTVVTSTFTHTTAAGNFQITGCPFASASAVLYNGTGAFQGFTKANYTQFSSRVNGTIMEFTASGSGQSLAVLAVGDVPTAVNKTLRYTTTYFV